MRILQLRFLNLNALSGEWLIDFTAPPYLDDGIFAITGPTGAGKTTILDAICLALYGRTPRLEKMSSSENEVMTRQTGECFAEVVFETSAGLFRAHWSQHRARRRADGQLQNPKHEFVDHDSNRVIASKIRDVAREIVKVTGMDFERFTRSMLLAQGGIAAFLQADASARAPILEQITGTAIYSDISRFVHQRFIEENQRLEKLEAELAGLSLLDDAAIAEIEAELDLHQQTVTRLAADIEERRRAIERLQRLAELQSRHDDLAARRKSVTARQAAFRPQRARLEAARRALELEADFTRLESARAALERDVEEKRRLDEALPARKRASAEAAEHEAAARQTLENASAKREEMAPRIRQARALDLELAKLEAAWKSKQTEVGEKEKQLAEIRASIAAASASLAEMEAELTRLREDLAARSGDEVLLGEFEGLRARFDDAKRVATTLKEKRASLDRLDIRLADAARDVERAVAGHDGDLQLLREVEAKIAGQQKRLEALLRGEPLSRWRGNFEDAEARRDSLERLKTAFSERAELERRREALGAAREKLEKDLRAKGLVLETAQERAHWIAGQLRLLRDKLKLEQRIESLEAARAELREGEPCPLCGSLEHPWAEHGAPGASATEKAIAEAEQSQAAADKEIRATERVLVSLQKDLDRVVADLDAIDGRKESLENEIAVSCKAFSIDPATPAAETALDELLAHVNASIDEIAAIVVTADAVQEELALSRQEESAARQREQASAAKRRDAGSQHARLQQEHEHLERELEALEAEHARRIGSLGQDFLRFGIEAGDLVALEKGLDALASRKRRWQSDQQKMVVLDQDIGKLKGEITVRQSHEGELEKDLQRSRKEGDELEREIALLRKEREAVFGSGLPDAVEQRLADAVARASETLEACRAAAQTAAQALDKLQQRSSDLSASITAHRKAIDDLEAGFSVRLGESGFADEAGFKAARLPETARKRLEAEQAALAAEASEIEAALAETGQLLDEMRAQAGSEESLEKLGKEREELEKAWEAAQRQIGALRARLEQNEKTRRQQAERLQEIEKQKRECKRWRLLHDLIGSADGKKYRNFAQGLTFEMMISHANRQLRKMSDRYLLVRDESEPLELNVIDNYQAGEIRSTKNLSGGESFIVSLALALGLSGMASRNVRVDSLFLDEGFGTLDEDALETALTTLSGLHQEGKLIGVISHVAALKERIPAQIEVTPRAGGRSKLNGPGCVRLD